MAPVTRRRGAWRVLAVALSVGAHFAILLAFMSAQPRTTDVQDAPPIVVALIAPHPPPPLPQETPAPRPSAEARPAPRRHIAPRPPPAAESGPISLVAGSGATASVEVDDADLAGATTAGSERGSGSCNMIRRLQDALRKDRMVSAAVAQAHRGKAILVWNGDWVRHPGQDGNGLAAVREAILWEVGFAPAACRAERMQGLVLISMKDGPDASRLVVGAGAWRWSDLLGPRAKR